MAHVEAALIGLGKLGSMIPDKVFHKIPGGYFRPPEEERRSQDSKQKSNRSSRDDRREKDERRSRRHRSRSRSSDRSDTDSDYYHSDGARRSRHSRKSDYSDTDDEKAARRRRRNQRRRASEGDKYRGPLDDPVDDAERGQYHQQQQPAYPQQQYYSQQHAQPQGEGYRPYNPAEYAGMPVDGQTVYYENPPYSAGAYDGPGSTGSPVYSNPDSPPHSAYGHHGRRQNAPDPVHYVQPGYDPIFGNNANKPRSQSIDPTYMSETRPAHPGVSYAPIPDRGHTPILNGNGVPTGQAYMPHSESPVYPPQSPSMAAYSQNRNSQSYSPRPQNSYSPQPQQGGFATPPQQQSAYPPQGGFAPQQQAPYAPPGGFAPQPTQPQPGYSPQNAQYKTYTPPPQAAAGAVTGAVVPSGALQPYHQGIYNPSNVPRKSSMRQRRDRSPSDSRSRSRSRSGHRRRRDSPSRSPSPDRKDRREKKDRSRSHSRGRDSSKKRDDSKKRSDSKKGSLRERSKSRVREVQKKLLDHRVHSAHVWGGLAGGLAGTVLGPLGTVAGAAAGGYGAHAIEKKRRQSIQKRLEKREGDAEGAKKFQM